jgi:inorganic pyrophosphatase/exopolyphosphatase
MNLLSLKKYEPIYVIGHSNIDIDSGVSSKIMADILNNMGICAYYAVLENKYEFDAYNKKMIDDCMDFKPVVVSYEDIQNHNWFLVDHNDRLQSVGMDANVIGAIDHHPNASNVEDVEITDVCCTALHLFNKYKDEYEFSDEQKFQIYMAFLNDSTFGRASRYKESDEEIAKLLGFNYDYTELFKKYFVPTDLSDGVESKLYNGHKKYQFDDVYFESGYIEQFGIDGLDDYINIINSMDAFLGVWVDYENSKTYAYFKYNGTLKVFYYDFVASRATTILNDVIEYLKKREMKLSRVIK